MHEVIQIADTLKVAVSHYKELRNKNKRLVGQQ